MAVIVSVVEEEKTLTQLYEPLSRKLTGAKGALSKLAFIVTRLVDLKTCVREGEKLFDLRRASRFKGHGALQLD